jgi:hypothetical protein
MSGPTIDSATLLDELTAIARRDLSRVPDEALTEWTIYTVIARRLTPSTSPRLAIFTTLDHAIKVLPTEVDERRKNALYALLGLTAETRHSSVGGRNRKAAEILNVAPETFRTSPVYRLPLLQQVADSLAGILKGFDKNERATTPASRVPLARRIKLAEQLTAAVKVARDRLRNVDADTLMVSCRDLAYATSCNIYSYERVPGYERFVDWLRDHLTIWVDSCDMAESIWNSDTSVSDEILAKSLDSLFYLLHVWDRNVYDWTTTEDPSKWEPVIELSLDEWRPPAIE